MKHYPNFTNKMRQLYFDIEKHITMGGSALTVAQVRDMLGVTSNSTAERYIYALTNSGLIRRIPFGARTITLGTQYPPVEYRKIK